MADDKPFPLLQYDPVTGNMVKVERPQRSARTLNETFEEMARGRALADGVSLEEGRARTNASPEWAEALQARAAEETADAAARYRWLRGALIPVAVLGALLLIAPILEPHSDVRRDLLSTLLASYVLWSHVAFSVVLAAVSRGRYGWAYLLTGPVLVVGTPALLLAPNRALTATEGLLAIVAVWSTFGLLALILAWAIVPDAWLQRRRVAAHCGLAATYIAWWIFLIWFVLHRHP